LNAVTIENFAFDFRRGQRFGAHRVDSELFPVRDAKMPNATRVGARFKQKLRVCSSQQRVIPLEVGPAGLLPVPFHD
jgi:hypothetical protein